MVVLITSALGCFPEGITTGAETTVVVVADIKSDTGTDTTAPALSTIIIETILSGILAIELNLLNVGELATHYTLGVGSAIIGASAIIIGASAIDSSITGASSIEAISATGAT